MDTTQQKGIFIVFEGGEGSGKSTQISRLKLYLAQKYRADRVITTHEPGGGMPDYRQQIFDIRKEDPNISQSDLAEKELELFEKDRALHVANLLRPKKDAGYIVLCDRFMFSTIAYQGYARGMDLEKIRRANADATQGFIPDLAILMDLDPAIGLERKFQHQVEDLTPFDKEPTPFHKRVRQGFLAQAAEDPEHWIVVDASQDADVITQRLIGILDKHFGL